MIESIMYFGIGFLVAALSVFVVMPLVHGRAVRLTIRRLEAAIPRSMAEVQADKDLLRAEFAMSTRRLEMSVEQLKNKTTNQLVELGRRGDAINQLKIELGALRDQLRATAEEATVKATAVHNAKLALADKDSELAKLTSDLDERSMLADSQKIEIVALTMQLQTLKERLTQVGEDFRAVKDRRDAECIEFKAEIQKLMEERGKVENLDRRVAELEQQLVTQTTEAKVVGRRAQDLENRLIEQSRLLNESEVEFKHLRSGIEIACKAWAAERAERAMLREYVSNVTAEGARRSAVAN